MFETPQLAQADKIRALVDAYRIDKGPERSISASASTRIQRAGRGSSALLSRGYLSDESRRVTSVSPAISPSTLR